MRAAIVGCGAIAWVHAESLHRMEDCEIVGVADIAVQKAQDLAKQYGGYVFDSLEQLISCARPDVIHICTPHYLHVPMAVYGLEQGVHVFMEKPPAISKEQHEMLKKAVKSTGSRLGFCFQNRYNYSVRMVQELLASGRPGKIRGARGLVTWNREETYYTNSSWRGKLSTEGGGALINQAIHTLDLLCCFLGRPLWVEAGMGNHHLKGIVEVEDTIEAYVSYENAAALFYATTAYCDDVPPLIEIACENMTIRIEEPQVTIYHRDGRIERPETTVTESFGKNYWGSGHAACIADFYNCLKSDTPFSAELSNVEDTLRLMLAVYQSSRNSTAVIL